MSYNYAESATLTAAASNRVVASDALMTESPDYKSATLSGGATYTGWSVISGGTATVGRNATLSGATVGNNGTVFVSSAGKFYGGTIKSGGWVTWAAGQNFPVFSAVTIEAGGTLYLGNGSLYGRNNTIAVGGLGYNLSNTSASVDGVLYGVTQKGGAFTYFDIVFSNFVNNGGFTYMSSGCSILNGQAIKAGAGFGLGNSSYLYNANVGNGYIWIQAGGAVISLGGANTNITKGHVYHCAAAGTSPVDNDLYASGGVLYGVTLKTNGNWLRDLTIVSGLTISAPVVSDTGKLTLGQGGIAANASVEDGGRIEVRSGGTATGITATDGAKVLLTVAPNTIAQGTKNGSAFNVAGPVLNDFEVNNGVTVVVNTGGTATNLDVNAGGSVFVSTGGRGSSVTVNNGGVMVLSSATVNGLTVGGSVVINNAAISGLVVKNGGWMSAATPGTTLYGLTVEDGGYLAMRATTISGDINVKSGTLGGFAWVTSDSIDGAAYGMGQNAGAFHLRNVRLYDFTNSGACYTYLSSGTVVSNGSAVVAKGGFAFCNSGYLYNAKVTNGWIWGHEAGGAISLGGAETNITQGNWYHCGAGGSSNKDANLYAANGVLHSATIKNNGNWLRKLTVLEGLTITESVVSSGGSLSIGSGGSATGVSVLADGRFIGASGGSATDITLAAGANLIVGIASDTKLQGTSNGVAFDFQGSSVSDYTLTSGMAFHVSAGGTATGVTVSTGQLDSSFLVVYSGGTANDIDIRGDKNSGQYCMVVSGGGVASNVTHSGGGLWVYGDGTVRQLQLEAGETVFQDSSYASDVSVSGTALFYIRNSALVENLHMSGANARFTAGTIRNATFEGTISGLNISNGFLIESALFDNGGVISVCSGGLLKSATLNSHGVILVSKGAEVTDLVVNADDWGGRLKIYDGGHVSGMTITGTEGTRNYVSMFEGAGVLEDVTTDKAGIYLASGGIIRDLTQKNGASVILRGEKPYASGANVLGGNLYFQNGAKGEDIVVNGGVLYIQDDAYAAEVKGSGATVSRADVVKGAVYVSAGGKLLDARLSGGYVQVASTGSTYGVPLVSGATITGGTVHMSGAALSSIRLVGDGRINISGGSIADFDIEVPVKTTNQTLNLSGGAIASGGRINGMDKKGVMNMTDGAKFNEAYVSGGSVFLSANAEITNVELTGGAVILRGEETYASGATVLGGTLHLQNGADGDDITVAGGSLSVTDTAQTNPMGKTEIVNDVTITAGAITVGSGGTINDLAAAGGTINVSSAGTVNNVAVAGGKLMVFGDGTANDVTITENGSAIVSGTLNVKTSAWNVTVNNGGTIHAVEGDTLTNLQANTGATVDYANGLKTSGAMLRGDQTNIAANTLKYQGNALDATVANGVMTNLGNNGKTYRLRVGEGITVQNVKLGNGDRLYAHETAVVDGGTINAGGNIGILGNAVGSGVTVYANYNIFENGSAVDTTVEAGAVRLNNGATGVLSNTLVKSGAKMIISGGAIRGATFEAGATLEFGTNMTAENTDTGDLITLDFTGTTGNQSVNITNLGLINTDTEIVLKGETAGNTYTIATTGSTEKYVNCGEWGLYDDSIKATESITNAFTGMSYEFNAAGTAITVTEFTAATQETAGSIESGTDINGNGKAAKWTANTTATGTIKAATSAIAGDAWLELDGANLAGTTLFGAAEDFAGGAVNIYATNDAVVGNLAAGATSSGTVQAVKLTVDSATVGLAYAGGFGNVTGKTETLIGTGATMQKDFYAGALANYAKTSATTTAGNISLAIADGTFNGNIYGAAAVKAKDATTVVHSVGNVTIDIKGGTTTKGAQACLFAGGYATGNTTSKVYTVGNIDVTIDGGNWGAVAGGRGVFGGAFASKVTAEAQDVSITINGGTFGNVYGGGWSQQGGTSIVGDVNINIDGGTITNVFGGGTHSTTGGYTTVGDVTINVSGGSITGDIYIGGQQTGDTTGAASVNFTGDQNFACGVYGYSYGGGTTGDAALSYTSYTGTFSGAIGGFAGITLDDDTAMTLGTAAADVSNGKWEFDFTARDAELAGTSFLTWDSADFAGDTVRVNFADADQAAAGWSIATAEFTGATFDLWIGSDKIAEGIAYDTAVGGETAWADWKFNSVDGTLKFAQITA